MLTRQGAAKLFQAEFRRLADIDIYFPDTESFTPVYYRPLTTVMAEKTVSTLLSKTLEQTRKYSGKSDQDADEWLKDLTTTFRMADITESQALKMIPTFLEGPVKLWFHENSTAFESWSVFKAQFLHTYSSPALKQLASNRLRHRQQQYDESVIEYYTDVMKLCKIIDPNMTDASKFDHLYHGLKPSLLKILRQAPLTPTAFLEYARPEETLDRFVGMPIQSPTNNDTPVTNINFHQSFTPAHYPQQYFYPTSPNTYAATSFPHGYSSTSSLGVQQRFPTSSFNTFHNSSHPVQCYREYHDGSVSPTATPSPSSSFPMIRHYHHTHPPSLYHSMSTYSIHPQSTIYSHQPVQTNPSLIFINTSIHGKRLRAMLDTGATHSFIIQRTLKQLHRSPTSHFTRQAQLGDGRTTLQIIGEVQLPVQFASIITPLKALVVKQMNSDFILGSD
ncbi:unnamed protein product [Rotaria magnacalcarata]|uniref:Retrotransposon gag domain-containing protein n=3 Tax=Rotaria magnacalcarata TaxID=392030 RepID=A0A8S2SYX8_9BILA|nr:unnamed protein product [Rotaria magnacalcarata]